MARIEVDADDLREVLDEIVRCGSTAADSPAGQAHDRLRAALPPEQIRAEDVVARVIGSGDLAEEVLNELGEHGYRIVRKDDDEEDAAANPEFAQSFDAREWSKASCQMFTITRRDDGEPMDESLMDSWFANAIMCGYDEHARRKDAGPQLFISSFRGHLWPHPWGDDCDGGGEDPACVPCDRDGSPL